MDWKVAREHILSDPETAASYNALRTNGFMVTCRDHSACEHCYEVVVANDADQACVEGRLTGTFCPGVYLEARRMYEE